MLAESAKDQQEVTDQLGRQVRELLLNGGRIGPQSSSGSFRGRTCRKIKRLR
jgi:hypothetical protein